MISVVVTTYNGEKYILKQLNSIANQTLCADEVIILDDKSTDSTQAIVNDFLASVDRRKTNWRFIQNENNLGYSLNFYKGIKEATGGLIFLCDQDDIWHPTKLEKMSEAMKTSDATLISCRYDLIDGDGEKIENAKIRYNDHNNDGSLTPLCAKEMVGCSMLRGCSICFKAEIKPYLADLDLSHLLSHDWLISIISALTGKVYWLNLALFDYRLHDKNTSLSINRKKSDKLDLKGRILGLCESVKAHKFLLENKDSYKNFSPSLEMRIKQQIALEEKRICYLKGGSFINHLLSLGQFAVYKRYYKSFSGALRVFVGDILYKRKGN